MRFDIITIFPEIFSSYFGESILKRAQENKLIKIGVYDLRKFSTDKHKKARPTGCPSVPNGCVRAWSFGRVDDKAYGGGPGMVFKIEPIFKATQFLKNKNLKLKNKNKTRTILFSTRGKKFDNKIAKRLTKYDQLILICGRYEGVDERVAKYIADEEISIGDYVLTGGELPAMVVVDSVSRHIPGVLGKQESLEEIKGSYPVYTRPEIFVPDKKNKKKDWRVPKVLMSGDHKAIEEWRKRSQK